MDALEINNEISVKQSVTCCSSCLYVSFFKWKNGYIGEMFSFYLNIYTLEEKKKWLQSCSLEETRREFSKVATKVSDVMSSRAIFP